mmetsp:Transcript_48851/g.112982  ORF Transcript_48851/g.112982 Transcript_48851/m.112982 type:complete len:232 (+) Transcript_48851:81-776(+)
MWRVCACARACVLGGARAGDAWCCSPALLAYPSQHGIPSQRAPSLGRFLHLVLASAQQGFVRVGREVQFECGYVLQIAPCERASHLSLELLLLAHSVNSDVAVRLELFNEGTNGFEEVGCEGVEVPLVLEAHRIEVLGDDVQVQLMHRRHGMESSEHRRKGWGRLSQLSLQPACECAQTRKHWRVVRSERARAGDLYAWHDEQVHRGLRVHVVGDHKLSRQQQCPAQLCFW